MKQYTQKNNKRKRGETSTRINVLDYLTGTFFIVLVVMIVYGIIDYLIEVR